RGQISNRRSMLHQADKAAAANSPQATSGSPGASMARSTRWTHTKHAERKINHSIAPCRRRQTHQVNAPNRTPTPNAGQRSGCIQCAASLEKTAQVVRQSVGDSPRASVQVHKAQAMANNATSATATRATSE